MKQNDEQWLKTIGDKLRHYEEPVPPACWQQLAQELQAVKPVRRHLSIWKSPLVRWVAAAVLLGLVCTIGWQWQRSERLTEVVEEAAAVYAQLPEPEPAELPEATRRLMAQADEPAPPATAQRSARLLRMQVASPSPQLTRKEEISPNQADQERVETPEEQSVVAEAEPSGEPSEPAAVSAKRVRKSLPYTPAAAAPSQRSSRRGWALGMAVDGQSLWADGSHTSGRMPVYSSDFTMLKDANSRPATEGEAVELPTSDKLVSMDGVPSLALSQKAAVSYKHKLPLTFGLTLRKELGSGFSVESGLTYTLLASDLYKGNSTTSVSQKLHYVGVPLRAHWAFYQNQRLSAYLSAGGAVEKCVKARRGGESLSSHPLQWSLTGAVGVECRLTSHLHLYVEPGVAHFFDDGSSLQSYRTEHPTGFSLQSGLRLSY